MNHTRSKVFSRECELTVGNWLATCYRDTAFSLARALFLSKLKELTDLHTHQASIIGAGTGSIYIAPPS
jgi:hypothetical protein